MKLASLKSGRDGKLIVVSKDLTKAAAAEGTLQDALDDWDAARPKLERLSKDLEAGTAVSFPFNPAACAAPLPRAYQWLDASAYVSHVELVRKSRGAEMPPSFWTDPLMYQGGSDTMLGPRDDILMENEDWGIDFEGEVSVVTGDVPMGVTAADAGKHIKLVMLVNDISLRHVAKEELTKGFGFVQSKPPTGFSPVAVTPDELGDAWIDYKLHLPLLTTFNGKKFGSPNAGTDMTFSFAQLVAHAARSRPLGPGTIIGSGTVSNKGGGEGSSCIVEKIILEKLGGNTGPRTEFMKFGDTIRIEMNDAGGKSIFGAIEQTLRAYKY